jgi:Domain of unknown function (DUF4190)
VGNPGPDQPSDRGEYPSLENSPPAVDPFAPVDYPSDHGQPPPTYQAPYQAPYGTPPGLPQSSYPPPPYPGSGYPPPPGYSQYPNANPYAYDPYSPPRPPGTNGKAIGSLVTSLVGVLFCGLPSIVGMILGVMAMRETKQTGQEGYGLALAGVIVGAIAVVGWLLYVVFVVFLIAISSSPTYF